MTNSTKGITEDENGLKRIKTGVPGLNNFLEGGFPHPSTVLVAGDSGSGKTMFGLQYLYNGVQKYDEPGIYLRIQGYDTDVEWYSLKSGLNIRELQDNEDLVLTSYELTGFEQFEAKTVRRKIVKKLTKIADSTGAKRIVIDSVTPFGYMSSSIADYRTLLYTISKEMKEIGCTTLLITEKPEENKLTYFGVEPYISDGVVELRKEESAKGKGKRRVLHLNKMIATKTPLQGVAFNLSEEGFKLLPSFYE